jgi:hypothetical protein
MVMKKTAFLVLLLILIISNLQAQEIQTLFKGTSPSGGYGAISNKFTSINGEYANLVEVYGGWFVKRRFLLGVAGAASTNDIRVPQEYSQSPLKTMSWQYGQFGLMTEYVVGSNKTVHFNFSLFSGAGFTLQYERFNNDWDNHNNWDDTDHKTYDEDFFYVLEPGAQVEVNVFKWMRFSPGISYRRAFGSHGVGLSDKSLSDWSGNLTLKFGKF